MNAPQYCMIHANELLSSRISFSKKAVDNFIKTYTYLEPSDFNDEMRKRLKFHMIDLNYQGYSNTNKTDLPIEKIELSDFVLCIK